ncbi:MAG: short-chain dehydrogenase [marine bacterium B5-7]|nr:MAG: short-chain dehydrogenase [marine bacterium B5-7]
MTHDKNDKGFALFNLGFRPFFMGAAIYSVIVVLVWLAIYARNISLPMDGLSSFQWHAHEMIFGYSLAVIAGFLLTAVKNWTGIQTVHGNLLAAIFSLWFVARGLFLFGSSFIYAAAIFDLLFILAVILATAWPVIKAKNWRQVGILSKLLLLGIANLSFYLGYTGLLEQGMYWGIYGGLYLVIGLILTLGGRVIPFFTENGVGYPVQLYNPKWITLLGLLIFLVFFISELFLQSNTLTGYSAIALFIIYLIRLIGWYTPGIWKYPLLWSLHIATLFIVIGFLLLALSVFAGISKYLAIHAMTYGGIGMITVSMMARVSLGHTGRNINEPPETIRYILGLLLLGAVFRALLPLVYFDYYYVWVVISQIFWVMSFSLFVISYLPIWIKPRVDGQFG